MRPKPGMSCLVKHAPRRSASGRATSDHEKAAAPKPCIAAIENRIGGPVSAAVAGFVAEGFAEGFATL